jgi:hypothetical protein
MTAPTLPDSIDEALDVLVAEAQLPRAKRNIAAARRAAERAIAAALPRGEPAGLTVGAALALPEVQDGSHWILVDDPPDGYSDGYRVRVVGPDAQVCFDADGMPGDEAEDWTDLGALNAHGFADHCRVAPVVAAVPDRYVLMPLTDVPPGTPPEHVALVPDEGQGEWYLAKLRAGEPRDVLTWSDVLTRRNAPIYTFAIVDTQPAEVDRGPFDQSKQPGAIHRVEGCLSNECAIRNRCTGSAACPRDRWEER